MARRQGAICESTGNEPIEMLTKSTVGCSPTSDPLIDRQGFANEHIPNRCRSIERRLHVIDKSQLLERIWDRCALSHESCLIVIVNRNERMRVEHTGISTGKSLANLVDGFPGRVP